MAKRKTWTTVLRGSCGQETSPLPTTTNDMGENENRESSRVVIDHSLAFVL